MTSVTFSPILDIWIGIGFLKNGRNRIGEKVRAVDFLRGSDTLVEICHPIFFDQEGKRLRD